ncbi:flavin reductase family protein [Natronincola ferrireducens]|uniref:Flavin reductase like domain-containing protein n=1 Tax=Natronincola ferrireducens TaxID=393762 RepID=A0A1G9F2D1_9FIRM|nr:flavin reductase family protein [Natronincola ferrireducens]SDK82383.1 Flavin reductase like domain-containing protein [Natronincola ferrireducens]
MYREIQFTDLSKDLLEQLQKGGFLTVKSGDEVNTMTIAWGSLGFMWTKPVFIAMVRYSRYTYNLIESSKNFTVSFPLNGQLQKELGICGRKSGRDTDKIKECDLALREGSIEDTVVIDECDLHLECTTVYKQGMDESALAPEIRDKYYADGDYHVLYYGEIVKIYTK